MYKNILGGVPPYGIQIFQKGGIGLYALILSGREEVGNLTASSGGGCCG